MAYRVLVTAGADGDIAEILQYLADTLQNKPAAARFADALEQKYGLLSQFPYSCEECRDIRLKKQGYHKFVIDNYVGLYLVSDERREVDIMRVFYGKRDYAKYL